MKLKNLEVEVNPEQPFENDKLDRFENAKVLTQFVGSLTVPFVLCIDSGWGTGKTTFIRMWKQHLKNESFHCLYFNAWEFDFSSDPLIALIGELQSEIVSNLCDGSNAKKYFRKAKRIGASLTRHAVPAAAKIATAGILDLDEITEDAVADFLVRFAQERIENYEADKTALCELQKNLEAFAVELAEASKKPLVFFIDELDRCRPSYAIELLERVKHLFNVPGIIFVLALDKEQLAHSTRALYGEKMDADGYLGRFIDLTFRLPQASHEDFCHHLFALHGFEDYFRTRRAEYSEKDELLETFVRLSEVFGFSLRTQEQCFTQFTVALRTTPDNQLLFPVFLAFLIALKAGDESLYSQYIAKLIPPQNVIKFIQNKPKGLEFLSESCGAVVEAYLVGTDCNWDGINTMIAEYGQKAAHEEATIEERHRYELIIGILNTIRRRSQFSILGNLARKINVSESFTQ
jgi:hypothetical protein